MPWHLALALVLALTLALTLALALALSYCRGSTLALAHAGFAFDSALSRALPCALSHAPALAVSGSALDQPNNPELRKINLAPTATWEDRKLRWIQTAETEIERL